MKISDIFRGLIICFILTEKIAHIYEPQCLFLIERNVCIVVHEFDPDSYKKILSSLDIKQIKENWENMSGHPKKDKQAQKYFDQLVLLVQQKEAY